MAQITVSKYLQLIDELIDESRLAEAVAHSRHLLEQHPRHIDAYRSLGKALLEQGDYASAVDIFQRVLSAIPADFVAHAGLAIVHKAGDRWKQALWHMERAFEVEPYNGAVRAELQELYGRRDGLAPRQVELTRGALARLYVRGGLYQQAILELRALLAEEPDRVDLRLLLAEAHWRAEERVEAAEQCEAILELLPDCIDAHAILADIMYVTDDAVSALPHLERLQALTQLSQSSLHEKPALSDLFRLPGVPALPREISVDRLSDAEALGLHQQQETAAWISELALEAEGVEDDLGWLQELQGEGAAEEPPPPAGEVPDWLAVAVTAVQQPPDETEPEPPAAPDEPPAASAPEWAESLAAEEFGWPETPDEPIDAPDWLAADEDTNWLQQPSDWPDATPESGAQEEPEPEPPAESAMGEGAFTEEFEPEIWEQEADREGLAMEERGREQDEQPEAQDGEEEVSDLDWLQQLGQPEPTTEPGAKQPDVGEAAELPDWLGDEAELDWLGDIEAGAEPEQPAAKAPADDDLSWLDQIAGGQAEPPGEMPTLEWPDDDELDGLAEAQPATPLAEDEPLVAAETALDWLDDLPAEGDVVTAAWLDELAEEAEQAAADESSEPHLFSDDIGDLDWLEESAAPAAGSAAASLDWLHDAAAPPDDTAEGDDEEAPEEGALDWLTGDALGASGLEWLAEPESAAPPEPAEDEDEDEAIAADIFAAEESEEPPLDWLEAGPEAGQEPDEAAAAPEELAEAMSWLDGLAAGDEAAGADDVPEDLDEAMAWLEQLAARQGAPLDELPSVTAAEVDDEPDGVAFLDELSALALPEEELPEPHLEWMATLAEEQPETPADLDEAMAWLEGLDDEEEGDAAALTDWPAEDEADLDEFAGQADDAGDEAPAIAMDDVPEELDEALTWLEQLAARQEAPAEQAAPAMEVAPAIETPPAMQVPDVAMMYLDSLLVGGWQQAAPGEGAPALADELPDDAESALAWLEQLAAGPTTVAPVQEEAAPLDWSQEPEAETEAAAEEWAWTEQLPEPEQWEEADAEVALPDEAIAEEVEAAAEEWAWTEQLPEPEQWEEADAEAALPDEAIAEEAEAAAEEWAWTEQLPEPEQWAEAEAEAALPDEAVAEEAEAAAEEWAWTEQLPEPEQWEEAEPAVDDALALPAGEEIDEEIFDEIPEDPDEAMAWLERLAARQGAPLDELPYVDEVSEEVETPAWLAREMVEAEAAGPELPDAEALAEEMDWLEDAEDLAWLEDAAPDEAPPMLELPDEPEGDSGPDLAPEELAQIEAALDLDILAGEELEPALPEWLAGGDEEWSAELTDIDNWLVAEEQASRVDMPIAEPERPAPPVVEPAPRPEPAPTERIPAPAGSDADRLEAARAALDGGDVAAAIAAYHDFMRGGSGLNVVIADLEMATAAGEQPALLRLLGDAYMENGQLNRALESYRQALDLL